MRHFCTSGLRGFWRSLCAWLALALLARQHVLGEKLEPFDIWPKPGAHFILLPSFSSATARACMCQDDFVMKCESLLSRANSMLDASIDRIDQARLDDARQQLLGCYAALTEVIEIL